MFDFQKEPGDAPDDLKCLLEDYESLPFRRRGYERDALLKTIVEMAGSED